MAQNNQNLYLFQYESERVRVLVYFLLLSIIPYFNTNIYRTIFFF